MKFEDVEKAQREYINEKQKSEKNAPKPIFKITVKTFLIEFIVVFVIVSVPLILISSIEQIAPKKWLTTYLAALIATVFLTTITVFFIAIFPSYTETNMDEALKNYRKAYKNYFVKQQLSKFFDFLKYDHDSRIEEKLLWRTGILTPTRLYNSNDLMQGRYEDVDFMQADVEIHELTDDPEDNKTIFDGRWLIFGLPKKFNVDMVITQIGDEKPSLKNGKELKLIKTESEDFNNRFAIYAEDDIEALAILNPALIERIGKLGDEHGDRMIIYFVDNLIHFAIDREYDVFEPPMSEMPLNEDAEIERIMCDVRMVTDVVDILKLDRKVS